MSAIDRDVGENGQVHYRLLSGDEGKFKIEEGSGEISVRRPLESTDQNREYMLIVEASDSGRITRNFLPCCDLKGRIWN